MCIWDLSTKLPYEDFNLDEKVKDVYLAEVADRLHDQLGAAKVQIFEHTVSVSRSSYLPVKVLIVSGS